MNDEKRSILEEKWASEEGTETEPGLAGPTVDELQAQVNDLTDRLLRQQADTANFRRRMERDREENTAEARRDLLRGLLPVIDGFERALGSETENFEAYREGVELILRSMHDFLEAVGVERIDPRGEAFDPHLHDAVEHTESEDVPDQHVATVYQPGYRHAGKLLRPAMVGVARRAAGDDGKAGD